MTLRIVTESRETLILRSALQVLYSVDVRYSGAATHGPEMAFWVVQFAPNDST